MDETAACAAPRSAIGRGRPCGAPEASRPRWHTCSTCARFHHSKRTVVQSDGTVRLTMRVADTPDLLSSILAWGERVRVIEPEALRERVARTLEAALQHARL